MGSSGGGESEKTTHVVLSPFLLVEDLSNVCIINQKPEPKPPPSVLDFEKKNRPGDEHCIFSLCHDRDLRLERIAFH